MGIYAVIYFLPIWMQCAQLVLHYEPPLPKSNRLHELKQTRSHYIACFCWRILSQQQEIN